MTMTRPNEIFDFICHGHLLPDMVTRILLFEDREERYHWKRLFKAWLHVFRTVPARQVFYTQSFLG